MKKLLLIFLIVFISVLHFSFNAGDETKYNQANLENYLTTQTKILSNDLDAFNKIPLQKKHKYFLQARKQYKKIEPFLGYYFSRTEREINGPPIVEIEEEIGSKSVMAPHGFQIIEQMLFEDTIDEKRMAAETNRMIDVLKSVSLSFKSIHPYEYQVFDAMQMQVVRIYTLGITNYDCGLSKSGLDEAIISLEAIKEILNASYNGTLKSEKLFNAINSAQKFVKRRNKKMPFDYFIFYRDYIKNVSNELSSLRNTTVKNNVVRFQALNLNTQSLFEEDAYHTHFFTRLQKKNTNPDLILLGKTLFYDPILSRNNKIACATCHRPQKAFTDGLVKASGMLTGEPLLRNTPTLLNAALQRDLFYDARVRLLEDQVESVVQNEKEMHGDFGAVADKLNNSIEYKNLFRKAFANTKDTVISRQGILTAIAEFERTLLAMNSRFDKSIRNEKMLITENEIRGYNLFMGKAKCGQCHFAGLFNGALPPAYEESDVEILGVPSTEKPPYTLDADEGRYAAFKTNELKYAFKITTVRNSELTAPYMHNGVFSNLKEVLNFYNKGGGQGLKISVPTQTMPADTLGLTNDEIESVTAFLKSLTDTTNVIYFSGKLPAIEKQPELNGRVVGGEY